MAIVNILTENSYNFIDNNTGFYISENNQVNITLQDSQEYLVLWKSSLIGNDFTYTCIAKEYQNSIYLGNFTILNLPLGSDFDSLPFLLQITNGYLTIYTTDFSSNIYSIAINQFIDTSENVVIRDPLGNEVVYGEYDIVTLAVDNASKKEVNYYKLPTLEDDEKNKILMSQEGLWSKTEFPQPNWIENDPTAPGFIKNKPEKFISEQANWNETNPEAQGYITNKPSLKDFQADWNITDPTKYGYIHNKPTSLSGATKEDQSDWDIIDSESVQYIRNRPFGEMPVLIEKKEYHLTPLEVNPYYCAIIPFPYKIDLEEGQMFEIYEKSNYVDHIYRVPLRKYNGTDINGTQMEIYGFGNISNLIINGDSFKPDKNYPDEFLSYFIQFFKDHCKIFRKGPNGSYDYLSSELEIKYLNGRKLGSQHLNGELLPYPEKCENGSVMIIDNGKWTTTTAIPIDKAQPDWSIQDSLHPQFIKNKPFGYMEPIIRNNDYIFSASKLDNIFTTEEIPFYYESDPEQCSITWNGELYYASYKYYNAPTDGLDGHYQEYVNGIGNSRLIIPQGITTGPFRDSYGSETNIDFPFFIDFTNKRIYSSVNGTIKIEVNLYGPKKIDARFLPGKLLPDPTKYSDNLIMMTKDGKWVASEQSQVDWNNKNPVHYEFIKNKPFGELPFLLEGVSYIVTQTNSSNFSGIFSHVLDTTRLITGKKYNVLFNNKTYQCTCFINNLNVTGSHYFGNASLLDKSKKNTGEPFFISIGGPKSDIESVYLGYFVVNNDGTLNNTTFNIRIDDKAYKTIESKYLPLDKTLTKSNYAADAAAVGNLITEFQSIIEEQNSIIDQLRGQIYNLSARLDALDGGSSTPKASVVDETLVVEGSENNEELILTYGHVNEETLVFDTSNESANVTGDELNVSGFIDTTDNTLNTSGIVTTNEIWEV